MVTLDIFSTVVCPYCKNHDLILYTEREHRDGRYRLVQFFYYCEDDPSHTFSVEVNSGKASAYIELNTKAKKG